MIMKYHFGKKILQNHDIIVSEMNLSFCKGELLYGN